MKPEPIQSESETGPHTWEDFVALPDDDRRELSKGWLLEPEVPTYIHERIVFVLAACLHIWSRTHGGSGAASGYKVKIDKQRGFFPDVQFYRAGRVPAMQSAGSETPPDLAVEVISPGGAGRDRVMKLQAYARRGIPEYWIIDPEHQQLERLVLNEDGMYDLTDTLTGDVPFSPRTFPDLVIDLAELWHYQEASAAE